MSSSDESMNLTPPDIVNAAQLLKENLLPPKSKEKYMAAYKNFIDWKNEKNVNSFSENVLLAYFGEKSEKYQSSTLWAIYSMLKSTLMCNNGININEYAKLKAFLKRQSDGYMYKKSSILSGEDVERFINEAPDEKYLATKVIYYLNKQ